MKFNKQEGYCIEQQSIKCRKTKTEARNKGHRQSNEPIKTRSKYMQTTKSAAFTWGRRAQNASSEWNE